MEWIHKIVGFFESIGEFFVLLWNDDDRWWLIGGLLFLLIGFILKVVIPIIEWFKYTDFNTNISISRNRGGTYTTAPSKMKVTIKGVYQMNGPKPFTREINCDSSEASYYSQLMGNKSKQAQWIRTNFPGADTDRGFSMSINIK